MCVLVFPLPAVLFHSHDCLIAGVSMEFPQMTSKAVQRPGSCPSSQNRQAQKTAQNSRGTTDSARSLCRTKQELCSFR